MSEYDYPDGFAVQYRGQLLLHGAEAIETLEKLRSGDFPMPQLMDRACEMVTNAYLLTRDQCGMIILIQKIRTLHFIGLVLVEDG